MDDVMDAADVSDLKAQIAELSERLAEYRTVVGEVVQTLGHVGDEPDDLRDAVGQIEALLNGTDSLKRNDLAGLAEQVLCDDGTLFPQQLCESSVARIEPLICTLVEAESEGACYHGVTFDVDEAEGLSTQEIRKRWPRLYGPCPLGCGYEGIAYASTAHYVYGDW
jgi:hypothetical protein